jgi:hypothetical protein
MGISPFVLVTPFFEVHHYSGKTAGVTDQRCVTATGPLFPDGEAALLAVSCFLEPNEEAKKSPP